MEQIPCERLIVKTNLFIENGMLCAKSNGETDLLDLGPTSIEDGGFAAYDKDGRENICKIGFTLHRGKRELVYETKEDFRQKGYMSEAMHFVLKWICENTEEDALWLLIAKSNIPSIRIAEKSGFNLTNEQTGGQDWYVHYFHH